MQIKLIQRLTKDVPANVTRWSLSLALFVYLLIVTFVSIAKPITPQPDAVVATWPVQSDSLASSPSLKTIRWHVQQGQYPGNANSHYTLAHDMLARIPNQQPENLEKYYLEARLLQYQHRFEEAQDKLNKLLERAPNHVNGLLLKANLHVVKSEIELALKTCRKLVGVAELTLAAACSLEATSYQENQLGSSYGVLSNLLSNQTDNRDQTEDTKANPIQVWLLQMAADMALRLDKVEQAADWITAKNLNQQPLSYVVLWADIQRLLGNHQQIIDQLEPIVKQSEFKDDSLLIRLAMAETDLGIATSKLRWRPLAKQRIDLRVARNDDFHAADIARYYLFVDQQPALALAWAKENFKHAKLYDDQQLLDSAQSTLQQQEI